MQRWTNSLLPAIVAACVGLVVLPGCGTPQHEVRGAGPVPALEQVESSLALPAPSEVQRAFPATKQTRSQGVLEERAAADFMPGFSQHVTPADTEAIYSPDWSSGASAFGGVAFAIYQFEVSGWEGQPVLHIKWTMAPKDPGLVWLGFSNWTRDRWDWFSSPPGGVALGASGLDLYKDQASRETLVAVVVLGQGASSLLQRVWFTGSSARGDWWMQGRDPQHTSCSRFVGPDSPQEQWRFDAGVWSKVSFPDGSSYYLNRMPVIFSYSNTCYFVVAQSETEHLMHALHAVAQGGDVEWVKTTYPLFDTTMWHSLALGDDWTVYYKQASAVLRALDALDLGRERWMFQGVHRLSALAPAIGPDGNIYVSGEDELVIDTINKYLYSVNPAGDENWTYAFGECQITAPAIARNGTVYIGKDDGSLYAFHPEGSVAWTCDVGGAIGTTVKYVNADPAVGRDGTVYVTTQAPALCAVSAAGALQWSVPLAAQAQGTASIAKNGALHVSCADGKLYVFNPDGTPRWNFNTGVSQASPTLDANGTVYVGSDNGNLYAIRANGTQKWTFSAVDAIQAQPTISENGSLVFMDIDGWLYCVGPGGG